MATATSLVGLANSIKAVVTANQGALNIKRVDYGDVDRVTESIQVCIEPEYKRTELRTVGGTNPGVTRTVRIYVLIYFAFVTNPAFNREFCDTTAESLELVINTDASLSAQVINGFVTEVASGYARKDGIAVRASRLTYEATVVQRLQEG